MVVLDGPGVVLFAGRYWSDLTMALVLILAIGMSKVEFKAKDTGRKKVA